MKLLSLEAGRATGGGDLRRPWPGRGSKWKKRRGGDLRDLPVPDFTWTVWLTWKTWFKDEEKND